MEKFDLNKHMARLLLQEPFFAALSRTINKIPATDIPTAGVCVNEDTAQFEMLYNPEFFEGLTDVERAGVIKHELYHVIFEHVTGRLPSEGMSKRWNVATDLAINSHLRGQLPEGALFPQQENTPWEDVPWGKSAEWYMANIPWPTGGNGDGEGQQGSGGEGQGTGNGEGNPSEDGQGQSGVGSHDGWKQASQAAREMAKERLKNNIKKAVTEANAQGWGSVSGGCRRQIIEGLSTVVDWRKVLRYFIKTSQRADRSNTMRRINRRYPYIHPGRRSNRVAHIAVSIDQSGSVSDQLLGAFFSELNKLAALASFTVIPFDDKVFEDKVYEWKKGENRKRERVLCGGTNFDAPTEYVNAREFDGHIVLTDMYAPKPKSSKCQRMWMTDKDGASRPYFSTNERIIAINA